MTLLERPIAPPRPRPVSHRRETPLPQSRAQRQPQRLPWLLGAIFFTALAAIIPVFQTSDATAKGYELRELEQQRQDWQFRLSQQASDIAGLTSLDRIELEAGRLGLVPAQHVIYLEVPRQPPDRPQIPRRFVQHSTERPDLPQPGWRRLLNRLPWP